MTDDYLASRSDAEIVHDVKQRLRWHLLIDGGLIDVACDDGRSG